MSQASTVQDAGEIVTGEVHMDRNILTEVQWDLWAITEHLRVLQGKIDAAIEQRNTGQEGRA